jgi:hypothetical protein
MCVKGGHWAPIHWLFRSSLSLLLVAVAAGRRLSLLLGLYPPWLVPLGYRSLSSTPLEEVEPLFLSSRRYEKLPHVDNRPSFLAALLTVSLHDPSIQ